MAINPNETPLLTLESAATRYGFPVRYLRSLAWKGKLPGAVKVGGMWRIKAEVLVKEWGK